MPDTGRKQKASLRSPSQEQKPRLAVLLVLALLLLGVWATTSPTARRQRLERTPTNTLRERGEARPGDSLLQLTLGRRLIREGGPDEAAAVLNRAINAGEGSPELLAVLGEALARAGRDEEAFSCLRLATAQGPRGDALRSLGALYLKHERPDKALPELERAVQVEPDSIEGWQLLALARRKESNWTEVSAALKRAVTLSPDDPELRLALGEALLETGQLDAAEPELRRAREGERGAPPSAARGSWREGGTAERSEGVMARGRVHTLLGRLYLSRAPFEENSGPAEAELRRALELDPDQVPARFALADVLLRRGRAAEAQRELRELLRRDPNIVQARFRLAQALRRLGRTADAQREMALFHRAYEREHLEMQLRGRLTLRPNDPVLRGRLDRLLKEPGRARERGGEGAWGRGGERRGALP